MKVRLFDTKQNKYVKVQVYAMINSGIFEKYLVLIPDPDGDYFKMVDVMEKTGNSYIHKVNVILHSKPDKWIKVKDKEGAQWLGRLLGTRYNHKKIYEYHGFEEFIRNKQVISALFDGKVVPVSHSGFGSLIYQENEEDWNYIETTEDINKLMNEVSGFHDSIIRELNYVSGGYVDDKKWMYPSSSIRKVTMYFDSQMCPPFELVFEGVKALNVRPADDGYEASIFRSTILIKDGLIYLYDDGVTEVEPDYTGTWVSSYSLRWRFI